MEDDGSSSICRGTGAISSSSSMARGWHAAIQHPRHGAKHGCAVKGWRAQRSSTGEEEVALERMLERWLALEIAPGRYAPMMITRAI